MTSLGPPLHVAALLAVLVLVGLCSLCSVLHNRFEQGQGPGRYTVQAHIDAPPVEQQNLGPPAPIPPLQHPCHHAPCEIALAAPLVMLAVRVTILSIPMTSDLRFLRVGIRPDVPPPQRSYL